MITNKKVSVICLCYNHAKYVTEAIDSVLRQDYKNVELIVVDDASTDGSQDVINRKLEGTQTTFLSLEKNIGHCAAFNKGFKVSTGDYVIDLAADDLLVPSRIMKGVADFQLHNDRAGVHFSDAYLCDEKTHIFGTHYLRDEKNLLKDHIPSGNIYLNLITSYFICPPTMMVKRSTLEQLGGYDETLIYEDFDFWIRSSRDHEYIFNPEPLTIRRILGHSDSKVQFSFRSKHSFSTYTVCEKIFALNKSVKEDAALVKRCNYEIKQCIKTLTVELVPKYLKLIRTLKKRIRGLSPPKSHFQ